MLNKLPRSLRGFGGGALLGAAGVVVLMGLSAKGASAILGVASKVRQAVAKNTPPQVVAVGEESAEGYSDIGGES